jgi:hypothetical protein
MALSPPYSERVKLPHQPNPRQTLGKSWHWPSECVEVFGHPWQRIFMCQSEGCRKGWEFRKDELDEQVIGIMCDGHGPHEMREG